MIKDYWEGVWSSKKPQKNLTDNLPWEISSHDKNLEEALQYAGVSSGKVLELGCGSGNDVKFLAENGFDVTGIDISETAINIAKQKNAGNTAKFIVGDILYDIPSEQFDFIYDRGCIHNSHDILFKVFETLSKILKEHGKVIILAGNINNDPEKTRVSPSPISIGDIEHYSYNWFKIKLVKEVVFEQHPDYGNSLGNLFILEKKNIT